MGICSSASLSASRLVSLLNAYNNQDQSILDEILASFPISSLGHRLLDFTCCRNHGMFDACDALWLRIFGSEQPRRGQFQSASSWQRKQTASGWNPCRMGSLVSVVTLPYIYFTFKLLSLVTTALYHRFLQLVCFGLFLCEDLLHYPCNDAHQWDGCLGACRHHSHLYMLPMPLTTFLTKRWNLQWLLVCKHYEKTV